MCRLFLICPFALIAIAAAGADELSPQQLTDARKLYVAKCAKCHKLYDPVKYSDADWNGWMVKMSKKAKLKPAQNELLAEYLETLRKIAVTNAPAGIIKQNKTRPTSQAQSSASWSSGRAGEAR